MRAARVTIDLAALRHNLAQVRKAAPGARVMAAIKANGYGHGAVRVARTLEGGADGFGVACLQEAIQLREAGVGVPITLLEGFFGADELPHIVRHRLDIVVHHAAQMEALRTFTPAQAVGVWVKLDTGMHRIGFRPQEAAAVSEALGNMGDTVALRGFMTHLACADELAHPLTQTQLTSFSKAVQDLPGERSVANSAGILGWPASHGDWVRPGIMLYGVSPFIGGRAVQYDLRPVMTLSSELIAVSHFEAGDSVGYGATWTCPEPTAVGVVAMGYGDGYPRHAVNGTPVLVNGQRVPLVGRVSMDMLTVDLRACPDAKVGDPVTLWGGELPIEEVAEAADTIAYELLCGVAQRLDWSER